MPLHTILFGVSLLAIALFFAIKEREAYSGTTIFVTRLMVRWSPGAERFWNIVRMLFLRVIRFAWTRLMARIRQFFAKVMITVRYLIALLADRAIKAVRGERLLQMRGAPSMYLKHLKETKKTKKQSSDTVSE